MKNIMIMKGADNMNKLIKNAGFVPVAITVAEFLIFLVWGLLLPGGDEMGFSLIALYIVFPLTALISTAVLVYKKTAWFFLFAAVMLLAHTFLPFFIFSTFEFLFSFLATLIPCAIGAIVEISARLIKRIKRV